MPPTRPPAPPLASLLSLPRFHLLVFSLSPNPSIPHVSHPPLPKATLRPLPRRRGMLASIAATPRVKYLKISSWKYGFFMYKSWGFWVECYIILRRKMIFFERILSWEVIFFVWVWLKVAILYIFLTAFSTYSSFESWRVTFFSSWKKIGSRAWDEVNSDDEQDDGPTRPAKTITPKQYKGTHVRSVLFYRM